MLFTSEGVTECHCCNEICWWPSSRIPNTVKDDNVMGKKILTLRTAVVAARWNLIMGNMRCLHLGTNSRSYSYRLNSSVEKAARTSRMKRRSISWSLDHLNMRPEKTLLWWQSIQLKMNPCLDDYVNFQSTLFKRSPGERRVLWEEVRRAWLGYRSAEEKNAESGVTAIYR